jgi:ribosomal protein S27AE
MVTSKGPRPLAESHSTKGALSAEPDELTLPGWLNAAKGSNSHKRVVHILELIRDKENSRHNILAKRAYIHVGKGKRPREHYELWRTNNVLGTELHRSLKRYTFCIGLSDFLYGGWLLNLYCPRQKDDFGWETLYSYRAGPGQTILQAPSYTVFEGDAVLAALRLAERSLLNRVRLCERCSVNWIFAKHKNYKFCGTECRETYYTSTPEYRESKKRQMREYRDRQRKKEAAEDKLHSR